MITYVFLTLIIILFTSKTKCVSLIKSNFNIFTGNKKSISQEKSVRSNQYLTGGMKVSFHLTNQMFNCLRFDYVVLLSGACRLM